MPVRVYSEDEAQQVADLDAFARGYHRITAAGGLVINDDNQVLLIYRRGKWDLPKGKMEEGESPEVCAEREVKEETGLHTLRLQRFLAITYHTYLEKGRPVLKDTHWYLFRAPGGQIPRPQAEEEISLVEWVDAERLESYASGMYRLIVEVLDMAGVAREHKV